MALVLPKLVAWPSCLPIALSGMNAATHPAVHCQRHNSRTCYAGLPPRSRRQTRARSGWTRADTVRRRRNRWKPTWSGFSNKDSCLADLAFSRTSDRMAGALLDMVC